ncbi:Hypothetical_protein [Hexamita inflata]|uniref:Hypothetical_protein n=1 Tax=Hexamita inflata TaxID=28002 RepID=A0ABP1HYR5_9EUKA
MKILRSIKDQNLMFDAILNNAYLSNYKQLLDDIIVINNENYITSLRRSHFRLQGGRSTRLQGGSFMSNPLVSECQISCVLTLFFGHKPFKYNHIFGYILDTFHLQGVENGNPLISEKTTPLRARQCSISTKLIQRLKL